ncbi:MAG: carboxypeptidase regulatory-like domain-containing protein, partial [Acidobacteriota bacterium]|nr:carboxypeptidase regulatory-like domain-containing protein [Acidobacteriota bacterium]
MLLCTLVAPAWAQDQRGSIEGVVRDASGAVLPGATVEATANGVVSATVTDAVGLYRFPSLPPGNYRVSANLQGFVAREVVEVRVGLGQMKKVDFALPLAGVAETVTVTAQTPLVDVRSTSRQANIRAEQVELLPKGRDFTTMVTQAPGANQESKLGGISIDGASAGENRYIIDGIETTNLVSGTSGKRLISDFVEEVQVKSSGYTAEFGGATGGVINAMTKSGTNEMHGSGIFNYQSSSLAGSPTPTLRRNLVNDDIAEYITYPKDDEKRTEPGFTLGGPLVRDRAWFFGAYLPVMETTTRNVSPTSAGNPAAGT